MNQMKKIINFNQIKTKCMERLAEIQVSDAIKKMVKMEYVRQEISDIIESNRECGETEIIIDGHLPNSIIKDLVAINNVEIRRRFKFLMFPETVITIK